MNDTRSELIEAARAVAGDLKLREDFSAIGIGAAIRMALRNLIPSYWLTPGAEIEVPTCNP